MAAANSASTKVVALGGHTKRYTKGLNRIIMKRRLNYNVKRKYYVRRSGDKQSRLLVVYRIWHNFMWHNIISFFISPNAISVIRDLYGYIYMHMVHVVTSPKINPRWWGAISPPGILDRFQIRKICVIFKPLTFEIRSLLSPNPLQWVSPDSSQWGFHSISIRTCRLVGERVAAAS